MEEGRTSQQAWFVGARSDVGGAKSKDGLILCPLQWVVSEAKALGLVLGQFIPQQLQNCCGQGPRITNPKSCNFSLLVEHTICSTPIATLEFTLSSKI
jgi:hypothetical protein